MKNRSWPRLARGALALCLVLSACLGAGPEAESEQGAAGGSVGQGLTGVPACAISRDGLCTTPADCASGLCLLRNSGGFCTTACGDNQACPSNMECERRHTGAGLLGYCVHKSRGAQ